MAVSVAVMPFSYPAWASGNFESDMHALTLLGSP
jgi:hypothetical protein